MKTPARGLLAKRKGRRPEHAKKPGSAPGTLVYTGQKRDHDVRIEIIDFTTDYLERTQVESIASLARFKGSDTVTWINMTGVHDTALLDQVGDIFEIHPLVMEDIAHTNQRPKVDDFNGQIYIAARMIHMGANHQFTSEQLSMVIGKGYVISFQEYPGDVFNSVRNRLETGRKRIRGSGSGYLASALLDVIVDHYVVVAATLGDQIEELEESIIDEFSSNALHLIQSAKKDVLRLRRMVVPSREVVDALIDSENELIEATDEPFLRDITDHINHTIDSINACRDVLNDMTDLHISLMSHKMNEVMKVLTIVGTIFIPLTFVAGIYGMNFDNMPELHWQNGYFIALGLMALIAIGLLAYFKRKDWL